MTTVYFPASATDLRVLATHGQIAIAYGWAITDALRSVASDLSQEDLEFHCTYSAADASVQISDSDGLRRVIVADVPVSTFDAPVAGQVRVEAPIERHNIDAFLVDTMPFDSDDDSLAWYARQELEDLLG